MTELNELETKYAERATSTLRMSQMLREAYTAGFLQAKTIVEDMVQSHAEAGNIENYGHLSDKIGQLGDLNEKENQ